jgi:seryl-tRNA synthetase
MMSKEIVLVALVALAVPFRSFAQGQENFMRQQAYQEMQRVLGQLDVMQNNFDELSRRVSRLESKGGDEQLRAEIAALKSAIQQLRGDMDSQRSEIVKDISARIAKLPIGGSERKQAPASKVVYSGPHLEYTVQSGDSLYLISKAFNVPVKEIKEMNSLKSDNLRVGQKIKVPKK